MENKIKIIFDAKSENELFARMAVSSFIAPLNPTVDEILEIKTIISEAVTNAIIHGYKEDPEKQVILEVSIKDKSVKIVVKDEGCGIENIELARQPMYTSKPDKERSGMGFTIIETFSDDLKINSSNKGTELIITKNLKLAEVLENV
ncbi:MAG TPA: anti-sigma F factor [Tenericutes bacterium]|jgi:stage II sporulation protein AB (anti-sigma F factor)|nr:anti-sigma F factor [Mycoplasmatota bacterium]